MARRPDLKLMKLLHTMTRVAQTGAHAAALALCLAACTDIDLSNVNTEVTLGTGMSVPVGQTDTLYLSRIINQTDQLIVDTDGAYALQSSGNLSLEVAHIDAVRVSGLSSTMATQSLLTDSWVGVADKVEFSQNADLKMQINTDIVIPDAIKRLDRISIDPVMLTVTVRTQLDNTSNLSKFERLELRDFSFSLPQSIVCAPGVNGFDYERKQLSVPTTAFDDNGEIQIAIPVIGLEDLPQIADGILPLRDFNLTASGILYALARNVSSADINGFRLTMTYAVPDITATDIYGSIDSDIRVSDKRVNLGELPKLLTDKSTQININDIAIALSAPNPVGIPLGVSLSMQPLDADNNKINQEVTSQINIEPARSFTEPRTSNLWITNSDRLAPPEGFTGVLVPDLARLVGKVPASIDIAPSVDIITDRVHFIRLGEYYSSAVDYTVYIPFNFGEGSHLVYREEVNNINKDITDITDKVKDANIQVNADIYSTVPMALTISVTPYDTQGNDMSADLDYTASLTVDPDTGSTEPQQRTVTLKERAKGALSRLDRLQLIVEGDTRQASGILRPAQYVLVKMSAHLPDGITIEND